MAQRDADEKSSEGVGRRLMTFHLCESVPSVDRVFFLPAERRIVGDSTGDRSIETRSKGARG
jgi:hypothetical protein